MPTSTARAASRRSRWRSPTWAATVAGKKIEVVYADHQNKADVAAAKAREWFDTQGLDMLIGGTNSGTALAMAKVAAEKKKPFLVVGAASSALTNDQCTPYTVHWAYDTVALAKGTGNAVVKAGGKTWYFLTADYAFGAALQNDTSNVVKAAGGTVVGSVKRPLNASDFSSFLLQAQSSKAQILGLANAGGDTINSIKAANEFGVTKTMKLAGLLVFINDIHSLGLKTTQGMYLTDSWYWNQNAETRAWSRALLRQDEAHAVVGAGRRLLGHAAVPERRSRPPAATTPTRCWRRCARPRSTTSSPRAASSATTAAWCTTCT